VFSGSARLDLVAHDRGDEDPCSRSVAFWLRPSLPSRNQRFRGGDKHLWPVRFNGVYQSSHQLAISSISEDLHHCPLPPNAGSAALPSQFERPPGPFYWPEGGGILCRRAAFSGDYARLAPVVPRRPAHGTADGTAGPVRLSSRPAGQSIKRLHVAARRKDRLCCRRSRRFSAR